MANKKNNLTKTSQPTEALGHRELSPSEISVRQSLEEEHQLLTNKIQEQELLMAQEPPLTGNDPGDSAAKMAGQDKALAMLRFWKTHLEEVQRAIERLDEGVYGLCERCGRPIAPERLQAMPSTTFCISCARIQTRVASPVG